MDVLDRLVRFIDLDGDDQFEFVIGGHSGTAGLQWNRDAQGPGRV